MDRRTALRAGAAFLAAGCGNPFSVPEDEGSPRLNARPGTPTLTLGAGKTALGIDQLRDGYVHLPAAGASPKPLLLLLHGAGGSDTAFDYTLPLLEELGIVGLVVESRASTWDIAYSPFTEDPAFIDLALRFVFERVAIDAARVGIAGFSDGASYALSLGLPNGELFTDVFAWSPGFMDVPYRRGNPAIYVSHGTSDPVLPIDQASRTLVPVLRNWGYTVRYDEFAGGHLVPGTVLTTSLELLVG